MAICTFIREVRILESIFAFGVMGLSARCLMDLVVFRAGLLKVLSLPPSSHTKVKSLRAQLHVCDVLPLCLDTW